MVTYRFQLDVLPLRYYPGKLKVENINFLYSLQPCLARAYPPGNWRMNLYGAPGLSRVTTGPRFPLCHVHLLPPPPEKVEVNHNIGFQNINCFCARCGDPKTGEAEAGRKLSGLG